MVDAGFGFFEAEFLVAFGEGVAVGASVAAISGAGAEAQPARRAKATKKVQTIKNFLRFLMATPAKCAFFD